MDYTSTSSQPPAVAKTTTDTSAHMAAEKQARQVIIVTGLSGAGKSGVIRGLEDLGFYCIDNLPVPMLSVFLNLAFQANDQQPIP